MIKLSDMKRDIILKLRLNDLFNLIKILSEKLRGLDFSSIISSEDVGLDPSLFHRSSPSGGKYLSDVIKDIDIIKYNSIIDIGCGKGSAIRAMINFPFKRVDGLEASKEIARIAINNFGKLEEKRTKIFICDAINFDRYGDYDIFYFYNPFPAQVMNQVVEKIRSAFQNLDKEILIIYNNPICHNLIIDSGFSLVKEFPDEWNNRIYLYSNKAYLKNRAQ